MTEPRADQQTLRPAMLVDVPDELPLIAVPFVADSWHITWSVLTGAVLLHRRTRPKIRHLGTARTPAELAVLVRGYARQIAAASPCPTGKKRFRTDEAAAHALAQSLLSGRGHRLEQRRYQCGQCGDWHLTSRSVWRHP